MSPTAALDDDRLRIRNATRTVLRDASRRARTFYCQLNSASLVILFNLITADTFEPTPSEKNFLLLSSSSIQFPFSSALAIPSHSAVSVAITSRNPLNKGRSTTSSSHKSIVLAQLIALEQLHSSPNLYLITTSNPALSSFCHFSRNPHNIVPLLQQVPMDMNGTSTANLDTWGALSWDEEFEELCTTPATHDPVTDDQDMSDELRVPIKGTESSGDNVSRIPLPARKPATRKLASGHPGWSDSPSPSISMAHTTPPEVNRWVFSEDIIVSLDEVLADQEEYPRRAAIAMSALLHTDDEDFSAYRFPYGATGLKTVGLKKRNSDPFEIRRRERPGGSCLSHSETVIYPNQNKFSEGSEENQEQGLRVVSDGSQLSENSDLSHNGNDPAQGKSISNPIPFVSGGREEETLATAMNTELPGIEFTDDYVEESHESCPKPLDILAILTHDLEMADVYMQEKHEELKDIAKWMEQGAEATMPGDDLTDDIVESNYGPCASSLGILAHLTHELDFCNVQMAEKLVHIEAITNSEQQENEAKSEGSKTQEQEKKDMEGVNMTDTQESKQESFTSIFSKGGRFIRDCWNGHPLVLD